MSSAISRVMLGGVGAVVVTLCLAASSWSMSPEKRHAPDPERKVAHMTSKLDLSAEQQDAVRSLLEEASVQGKADAEQASALRKTLREQRAAFDADSAQQVADELGDISGRMAYRRASTQAQIYQLLTADQQTKMDAMSEKRRWRRHHQRKCLRG